LATIVNGFAARAPNATGAALEIQHKRHSFAPVARRQSVAAAGGFVFGRRTVYDFDQVKSTDSGERERRQAASTELTFSD